MNDNATLGVQKSSHPDHEHQWAHVAMPGMSYRIASRALIRVSNLVRVCACGAMEYFDTETDAWQPGYPPQQKQEASASFHLEERISILEQQVQALMGPGLETVHFQPWIHESSTRTPNYMRNDVDEQEG